MRVYFLSEKRGALTVGGAYFGVVDGFERSAEVDPADGLYCECAAIGYVPVRFRFDEEFLFSPPPHVKLYFSGGDVAVYLHDYVRDDPALRVIWQEHVAGSRLTLCMQGRLTLNLENETGFHLIPLSEKLETCRPCACCGGVLLEAENCFLLLSRDGEIWAQGEGTVMEKGETLKAEVRLSDSVGHTALCEWKGAELLSCTLRSSRAPTDATFALAFLESVLIGADVGPYLCDALKPKAAALKGFLGDFEDVVLKDDPRLVGLVYRRRERVFEVRTFRVDVEEGKVTNITEE